MEYWSQLSPLTHIVNCECNLEKPYILLLLAGEKKNELCNDEFNCWTNERMLFDTGYDTIRYNTIIGGATNHPVSKQNVENKTNAKSNGKFHNFLPFSFFFCNSISLSQFSSLGLLSVLFILHFEFYVKHNSYINLSELLLLLKMEKQPPKLNYTIHFHLSINLKTVENGWKRKALVINSMQRNTN